VDAALARERLEMAEAAVRDEANDIQKQHAIIRRLQNDGHETVQAEHLLEAMEHSLDALKHHRDILLEQLGLYKPGKSDTNPVQ
jgi:hypothetical protein